jgi:hypothetical protein
LVHVLIGLFSFYLQFAWFFWTLFWFLN